MKKINLLFLLTTLIVVSNLSAQAPNVSIKLCSVYGKTVGPIKITLKCDLCCQGLAPVTYSVIHKCMPSKSTICGTEFLLSTPYTALSGPCSACVDVWALPATPSYPVRYKVVSYGLGKYWIVSAFTNGISDSDTDDGVEFNLADIIEGGELGLDYTP